MNTTPTTPSGVTMHGSTITTAAEQWRDRPADQRYTELDDMIVAVEQRRNLSRARDVSARELTVAVDAGRLVINNTVNATPTHWSFGQLAAAAKAPAGYLRTLPVELAAQCLNRSLETGQREANKVLTIRDDAGSFDTLQAVTSTTYGRIWDADVLQAVKRLVERSREAGQPFDNPLEWSGKKSGLYASDHDCFVFMVNGGSIVNAGKNPRDGSDRQLNRGFMCWNSETGAASFGLATFLFDYVCGNHYVWGARDVKQFLTRHTSGAPGRFDTQALPILASYLNASASNDEAVIAQAQRIMLPEKLDELQTLAAGSAWPSKFSRGEVREAVEYAKREEGDCRHLWQFIQGATAAARDYQFADARVELERRAGKLLDMAAANIGSN